MPPILKSRLPKLLCGVIFVSMLTSACSDQATHRIVAPPRSAVVDTSTVLSPGRTDPLLGMGVIESADGDYASAFDKARSAGVEIVPLTFFWNRIESTFGSTDLTLPTIANAFYPPRHTSIALSIVAIDGPGPAFPEDLAGQAVNDPEVVARFRKLLSGLAAAMPDVDVGYLSVGNEIDLALHSDSDWREFEEFYDAVAPLAAELWPGAVIGATTTAGSALEFQPDRVAAFNRHAGSWLVTWYPLDESFHVLRPRDAMVQLADIESLTGKLPLHLMEVGYPSDAANLSSEKLQAQFFAELLEFVDGRGLDIPLAIIEWETDLSPDEAAGSAARYGLADNEAFAAYLASLGLRRRDGNPKEAWRVITKCTADC